VRLLYPAWVSGAIGPIPGVLRRASGVGTISRVPPVEVHPWSWAPTCCPERPSGLSKWGPPVKGSVASGDGFKPRLILGVRLRARVESGVE